MPSADRVMGGKVAVITGAAEGIGAGLVTGYRGRGWSVVVSATILRPPNDPEVLAIEGDIADPASADRVIGGALERFGRLDTLINNAGMVISKPFTDYTAADYAHVVGVSLTGFFWMTQRAIAAMATRYGGHVVNVSATVAGSAGSSTPAVLAALTKGGLAAATRSLAVEYAAFGIRVNAVSPGITGASAQVSDVVDGVLFLETSPYITGEILHIDGGPKSQITGQ
jgi:NAD(P)-dependent dehydrogenase (short-subunit alcohol dehydrogenase family)